MLEQASNLSGYSMPDMQPTVIAVSHQYFVDKVCHGIDTIDKPCIYRGLYTYNDRTIHLDQTLSPSDFNAVLIHELVHFLQHAHHKYTTDTCDYRKAREHEAYDVEQQYINTVQGGYKVVRPPSDEQICALK